MTKSSEEGYSWEGSRKRPADSNSTGRTAKRNFGGNEPLLKLLVPSYAVGALLGKGGTLLNELKDTYGGNIRISAGKEYYPSTQERVVILTGEVEQIIDLNTYIMEKVLSPDRDSTMRNVAIDQGRAQQVKIVLTHDAAGMLIGRGGLTIKAIQEESNAKVSIEMPDKASVPGERVLTMSGSVDERLEACKQVINLIAKNASNMSNTNLRYADGNVNANAGFNAIDDGYKLLAQSRGGGDRFGGMAQSRGGGDGFGNMAQSRGGGDAFGGMMLSRGGRDGFGGKAQSRGSGDGFGSMAQSRGGGDAFGGMMQSRGGRDGFGGMAQSRGSGDGFGAMAKSFQNDNIRLKPRVEIQVDVHNNLVGPILGKGGLIVKEMGQRSGGRFKFSDKTDDENRTLTISGNLDQAYKAYSLLSERVQQIGNQLDVKGF